jgi:hypothetical protein
MTDKTHYPQTRKKAGSDNSLRMSNLVTDIDSTRGHVAKAHAVRSCPHYMESCATLTAENISSATTFLHYVEEH